MPSQISNFLWVTFYAAAGIAVGLIFTRLLLGLVLSTLLDRRKTNKG